MPEAETPGQPPVLEAAPETAPASQGGGRYAIKAYLVLQRDRVTRDGEPNVRVIAGKLNRRAAEEVVAKIPGTYIQRIMLSKS